MSNAKRATVYFEPEIHRALRFKAAASDRSVSAIVNDAVKLTLAEAAEDLEAIESRKLEPNLDFERFVKALKCRGKLGLFAALLALSCGVRHSGITIVNASTHPLEKAELKLAHRGESLGRASEDSGYASLGTVQPRQVIRTSLRIEGGVEQAFLRYQIAGISHGTGCGPVEPRGLRLTITIKTPTSSTCDFAPS